jgi:hypothetical protein
MLCSSCLTLPSNWDYRYYQPSRLQYSASYRTLFGPFLRARYRPQAHWFAELMFGIVNLWRLLGKEHWVLEKTIWTFKTYSVRNKHEIFWPAVGNICLENALASFCKPEHFMRSWGHPEPTLMFLMTLTPVVPLSWQLPCTCSEIPRGIYLWTSLKLTSSKLRT